MAAKKTAKSSVSNARAKAKPAAKSSKSGVAAPPAAAQAAKPPKPLARTVAGAVNASKTTAEPTSKVGSASKPKSASKPVQVSTSKPSAKSTKIAAKSKISVTGSAEGGRKSAGQNGKRKPATPVVANADSALAASSAPSSPLPQVGSLAPDFVAPASGPLAPEVTLQSLRGQRVVLYFYPKDDTTGCTAEACGFRDQSTSFGSAGAVIIGVSPDPIDSHQDFATKHGLPFSLVSDSSLSICKAYGVWGEKSMYGRNYMGVLRTTFVIDTQGRIAHVFEKVTPKGHEQDVLKVLQSIA